MPFRLRWLEGLAGTWAVSHVVSVVVFLLTVLLIAEVLRQRRPPASAMSWLLAIALIPYLGVPLYLLLGGRKHAWAQRKPQLHELPDVVSDGVARGESRTARILECVLASAHVPRPSVGNSSVLLCSGSAAREAILGAIASARASVRITTFILGDDEVGDALLDALTRAARRGVEVRLLLDGFFAWRTGRRAAARARAAGVRIHVFMPMLPLPLRGRANLRNHRKIVVVDGDVGFIGGMNFAREYMGHDRAGWRDIMLELRGPAVARLDEVFRSDWAFAGREALLPMGTLHAAAPPSGGAPPAATGRAQVVPSGPDVPGDTLYDAVLTALFAAERRVWIATPYFIPDEALVRGLELAVRRGVEVTIVVPARSNHLSADLAGAASLRELEAAGARIRPWTRGMLHAKAAIFDDVAFVGSANFDMRSLFLSYEVSLLLTSAEDVTAVEAWFRETLQGCAPRVAVPSRVRAAFEAVGRLLAPLV